MEQLQKFAVIGFVAIIIIWMAFGAPFVFKQIFTACIDTTTSLGQGVSEGVKGTNEHLMKAGEEIGRDITSGNTTGGKK